MISLRSLGPGDLAEITRVHLQAFPDSEMSRLGAGIVTRYYRWQFDSSHPLPFAEGAWRDEELVGFVIGGIRREAVSGFVRRNVPAILVAGALHPRAARSLFGPEALNILRLAFLRGRSHTEPLTDDAGLAEAPWSFGVLSIGVVPACQGLGTADQLMDVAEAAARNAGAASMNLTVHPTNIRAVRFYERRGWQPNHSAEGWSGGMTKSLR